MEQQAKYKAIKNFVDHPGRSKQRLALQFSVSVRTINRWIAKYKRSGKVAFIHGNATLEPDCKIDEETRKKVVELYLSDTYKNCNFAFYNEMLDKYENIHISEQSVRNILHAAGIQSPRMWKKTKRRLKEEARLREKAEKEAARAGISEDAPVEVTLEKNRVAPEDGHSIRERCKYFGEMIQMDASSFIWFGGIKTHLHVAIDDSLGRAVGAYFDNEETLHGYYCVLSQILLRYGIPFKFLTDRRTVFEYTKKEETKVEKDTFTQFSYACSRLGIEIETTSVPEAKGRVERFNQTLQGRLPTIFKREGITDIDAANEYLSAHLDELFNDKFALPIDNSRNVFEKQFGGKELDEAAVNLICSILCPRTLSGQCIRYDTKVYKLLDENGIQQNFCDHTKVTVIKTFDNQLFATVNDKNLYKMEEVPKQAGSSKNFDADYKEPQPRKVYIPPMDHPWRFSSFTKHAEAQKHRIKLEMQKEDLFMDRLEDIANAGYMIMGHKVA